MLNAGMKTETKLYADKNNRRTTETRISVY